MASMKNTIARIEKLIALTENANENEARNAALQACRLITRHKLVLSEEKSIVLDAAHDPEPQRPVNVARGVRRHPNGVPQGPPVPVDDGDGTSMDDFVERPARRR